MFFIVQVKPALILKATNLLNQAINSTIMSTKTTILSAKFSETN